MTSHRNAINNADIEVTASILKTDDDTYALVLMAREGAADAMPKLKEGSKETEKTPEDKEDKAAAMHD